MFHDRRENFIKVYTFPLIVAIYNHACFKPYCFNPWNFFFLLEDLFAPNNLLMLWWFRKLSCLILVKRFNLITYRSRVLYRLTITSSLMITNKLMNLNKLYHRQCKRDQICISISLRGSNLPPRYTNGHSILLLLWGISLINNLRFITLNWLN